jgi:hypothetical protein
MRRFILRGFCFMGHLASKTSHQREKRRGEAGCEDGFSAAIPSRVVALNPESHRPGRQRRARACAQLKAGQNLCEQKLAKNL